MLRRFLPSATLALFGLVILGTSAAVGNLAYLTYNSSEEQEEELINNMINEDIDILFEEDEEILDEIDSFINEGEMLLDEDATFLDESEQFLIEDLKDDEFLFDDIDEDILFELEGGPVLRFEDKDKESIAFGDMVVGGEQNQCNMCGQCGMGLLNLCDEEECSGLGLCSFGKMIIFGTCAPDSMMCGDN